jgi:GT2 family glycosyltransferase
MSSGNLLNLAAFKQVGAYNESFFIDYVDHEYCLRLKKKRFSILTLKNRFFTPSTISEAMSYW